MAKDVVQDAAEKSNDWCPKCKTSGNCLADCKQQGAERVLHFLEGKSQADCKYHPNNKAQQTTYQAQEDKGARGILAKERVFNSRFPLSCSQGMLMNYSICIFYLCFGRVLLSLPFF